MFDYLERTLPILGEEKIERLAATRIAVIGLGGVGGAAAEALVRVGVGHLLLVDNDEVSTSNRNRQIIATSSTVGQPKVDVAKRRLLDINPDCDITTAQRFYLPDESDFLYEWQPDCILDAIDTVTAKLHLAVECHKRNILLLSSMGTGNRLDPSKLRLGDIGDTFGNGCPLARVIRRELRRTEVQKLRVVFSTEVPMAGICVEEQNGRHPPASIAFVPPAAGFLLAYGAIKEILSL